MKATYRVAVYYFNFVGITSLKADGDSLMTSKLMSLFNLLLWPSLTIICSLFSSEFLAKILESGEFTFGAISTFLYSTAIVQAAVTQIVNVICIYTQLCMRRKILKLIEKCIVCSKQFQPCSDPTKRKKLEDSCAKTLIACFFIASLNHVSAFFAIMALEFENILLFTINHWNDSLVLYLLAFVSFFLVFFEQLLICINPERNENSEFDRERLTYQLSIISDLLQEFIDVFSFLLTITMTFTFTLITAKVS